MITLGDTQGPKEPAPVPVISDVPVSLEKAVGVNAIFLDGKAWPLIGAASWGFVSGVGPQSLALQMQHRFAEAFAKNSHKGNVKLQLKISEATGGSGETVKSRTNTIEFQKLNLQLVLPSDYARHILTLEDDRYRWNRPKVVRDFNLTRKVNDILIYKNLPGSRQNLLREASILYRKRSLKDDGTPWTALDIVRYILTDILGYDAKKIDSTTAARTQYVPPNEIMDGEDADAAIARMLALEGNDLLIDEDGKVVIYDRTQPFTEQDFRELFPTGVIGRLGGAMHVVNYEAIRPQSIEHMVTPKIELLCTYKQDSGNSVVDKVAKTYEEAALQIKTGRVYVRNVTRTVVDGQVNNDAGEPLPRGSVVSVEKALEGFGAFYGTASLTLEDMCRYYGADAFIITGAVLKQQGQVAGLTKLILDPTAAVVKDAIEKDFRTLFEVPRFVIEQIRGMEALHADMLNNVTRTRAPSSVFSVISWLVPSSIMLPVQIPDGVVLDSFTDVDSASGQRTARDQYVPLSGAKVTIEDEDLGLIRIDWGQDFDRPGAVKSVVPGEATDDSYYLRQDANYTYNSRESFSGTGIKEDWECSFVISVIPDLHRDKRRLYRETRTPPTLKKPNGQGVTVKGTGPQIQRRIRLEDARFTHGIAQYELVPGNPTTNPAAIELGARGRFVNEAVITAVIDAENERIYKTFNDQIEGQMVIFPGKRNIKVRPRGSLRTVVWTYQENGRVTMTLAAERYKTPDNILSRLPADVLRATVRQLEPPAQGG